MSFQRKKGNWENGGDEGGGLRASNWRLPGFGSRETERGGENDLEDLENDLAEGERLCGEMKMDNWRRLLIMLRRKTMINDLIII